MAKTKNAQTAPGATNEATDAAESLVVTFKLEKQTKNALRYQEEGTDGAENKGKIGTLYVQKTTLPESPDRIQITIESL